MLIYWFVKEGASNRLKFKIFDNE